MNPPSHAKTVEPVIVQEKTVSIRDMAVFAGVTFFANLIAVFTVVNFQLAPVKELVIMNQQRIEIVRENRAKHEAQFGHPGMVELLKTSNMNLEKRIDRLEEKLLQELKKHGG